MRNDDGYKLQVGALCPDYVESTMSEETFNSILLSTLYSETCDKVTEGLHLHRESCLKLGCVGPFLGAQLDLTTVALPWWLAPIMSWYRGLLSPVVGYGFMFAVSFSSYGLAGRTLLRLRGAGGEDSLTLPEMSLAGVYAGTMNSPLRQIFERVKSVMQVRLGEKHRAPYSWSGACIVDLVRREGVMMGLFRGMTSTVLRETVQSAVYYPTYAITKKYLIPEDPARRSNIPEPILQMISGGVAGVAIWMPPIYSLDVFKTRMQVAAPGVYSGTWDCAVKTWRAEGIGMFSRGLGPSLLRAAPLHGLVFLGYETTLSILNGSFLRNLPEEEII